MPAGSVTTYEIYLVDNGRWALHARYRRDERDKALDEARTMERELNTQVKVVREVYNPTENSNEETTIYSTERGSLKPRASAGVARGGGYSGGGGRSGGGGGASSWGDDGASSSSGGGGGRGGGGRGASASMQGTFGAMGRLVSIILGSLVGAGLLTMLARMVFERSIWVQLHVSNLAPIQFMIFIGSFLMIAVPLATKKVRWAGMMDRPQREKPVRQAKPAKATKATKPAAEEPVEDAADAPPEAEAPAEEAPAEETQAEPEAPAEAEAEVPDGAGLGVEMQRETMGRFTTGLMTEVQKARPQLDAYNRFGVSLMLAGAVDAVGDRSSLDPSQRRTLLADSLTNIGTKSDAAKSFSSKYEEYMTEKRYLGMVQAGRVAADTFLEHPDAPLPPLKSLFDAWAKPQQQQAAPRIMAVMFTDMVGSTDMTQAKGDQAAQVIVRRHNSIVRAALAEYGGKQVKHTGDGIMAAFPSPASAVEATVAIQRAVAANNSRFPDQSLHLRIGINAGEPIEEEEDLFGATVQLAARVCAAAGTDQIVCTNVVKELAGGKGISYASRGPTALKGFSEKIPLFEVIWN
jgi:class 3 adenylate cyclase